MTIDVNQTLGQIATAYPTSTFVFMRHRLDFCCGGRQKLSDACKEIGVEPEKLIAEIDREASARFGERWDTKPIPELIDFIIRRYHDTLRSDVPMLIEAARKVERVHAAKPSVPKGLADKLTQIWDELQQHLFKEESSVFPAVREGSRGKTIHGSLRGLMAEHDDQGEAIRAVRELTTDFVPPPEACGTWRGLYAGLEKLEAELMEHIHLENNVMFPRALASESDA